MAEIYSNCSTHEINNNNWLRWLNDCTIEFVWYEDCHRGVDNYTVLDGESISAPPKNVTGVEK